MGPFGPHSQQQQAHSSRITLLSMVTLEIDANNLLACHKVHPLHEEWAIIYFINEEIDKNIISSGWSTGVETMGSILLLTFIFMKINYLDMSLQMNELAALVKKEREGDESGPN